MFGVMIVMLSGVLIGYILRNIRAIPALVSKINIYIIFLLLFVMGLSVGSNPQVIQGLGTLGLLGIAISVVSIAGSVFYRGSFTVTYSKKKMTNDHEK